MAKRKEPEVEFADVYVMSCDGRLIEQRLEPLPLKDAPKVLTVLDRTGRRHTYTHNGKMVRETLGPEPTEIPPPPFKPFPPCEICRRGNHAPNDPMSCWGYEPGSPNDPNVKTTVAEHKPKRHHPTPARPPGYPPSPPALPPGSTPTRIRGPRTV